jgi:hypothetical protein
VAKFAWAAIDTSQTDVILHNAGAVYDRNGDNWNVCRRQGLASDDEDGHAYPFSVVVASNPIAGTLDELTPFCSAMG